MSERSLWNVFFFNFFKYFVFALKTQPQSYAGAAIEDLQGHLFQFSYVPTQSNAALPYHTSVAPTTRTIVISFELIHVVTAPPTSFYRAHT